MLLFRLCEIDGIVSLSSIPSSIYINSIFWRWRGDTQSAVSFFVKFIQFNFQIELSTISALAVAAAAVVVIVGATHRKGARNTFGHMKSIHIISFSLILHIFMHFAFNNNKFFNWRRNGWRVKTLNAWAKWAEFQNWPRWNRYLILLISDLFSLTLAVLFSRLCICFAFLLFYLVGLLRG